MAAIAGVVCWHVWVATHQRPPADAAAYLASRLLLLAFLGGSAAILAAQGVGVHLHHLYLGGLAVPAVHAASAVLLRGRRACALR
jgi:hypothetical protein